MRLHMHVNLVSDPSLENTPATNGGILEYFYPVLNFVIDVINTFSCYFLDIGHYGLTAEDVQENPVPNDSLERIETLSEQLRQKSVTIAENEDVIETLNKQIVNMKSDLEHQATKINSLKKEKAAPKASEKEKELETFLGLKENEVSLLKTENDKMSANIERLEKEKNGLQEKINNLISDKSEEGNEAISQLQNQIEELKSELEQKTQNLTKSKSNYKLAANNTKKFRDLLTTIVPSCNSDGVNAHNREVEELREKATKIDELQTQISSLKENNKSLQDTNNDLQTDYNSLSNDYDVLQEDYNKLDSKRKKTLEKIKEHENSANNREETINEQKKSITELTNKNNDLIDQVNVLKGKITDQASSKNLKSENEKLKKKVAELEKAVELLTSQLEAKNAKKEKEVTKKNENEEVEGTSTQKKGHKRSLSAKLQNTIKNKKNKLLKKESKSNVKNVTEDNNVKEESEENSEEERSEGEN